MCRRMHRLSQEPTLWPRLKGVTGQKPQQSGEAKSEPQWWFRKPFRKARSLTFSLDLEGAFDNVPRTALATSLRRLGVSETLVQLLMQFHFEARYHCSVGAHEDYVTTTRGIKQGCTVVPYLFVAHTIAIIDTLAERLGWDWITQLFTFYADDALAAWTLKSAEDLQGAIGGIQKAVQTFNDHGMTLSATKSVVLCHAKGADAIRILQKLKVFKDKLPHLAFMQHGEQILIPLRKTHQYLGTVISYRDAQEKTVQLRMRKARGQYSQLRKAINSRRVTHNRPRYQIWRAGAGAQLHTGYWRWALDPRDASIYVQWLPKSRRI